MKKTQYTMGSDPELMVKKGDAICSAIPLLHGDKYNKEEFGNGFAIYSDNVLAEANVPPADSPENFVNGISQLFNTLKERHPELQFSTTASHTFTEDECQHKLAKEFGCNPEFDAYIVDQVQPPQAGHTFRSAGGHIHLGNSTFNKKSPKGYLLSFDDKINAILLMDIYVGIPLVLMDNDPTSPPRKILYGKAGRFRPTDYGVEYRTPSPYWLSNPRIASIVSKLTFLVMEIGDKKQDVEIINQFDKEAIKTAIDNHDKALALQIFNQINLSDDLKGEILEFMNMEIDQNVLTNW